MTVIAFFQSLFRRIDTLAQHLEAPFMLALRVYVADVFLKSGWLKLNSFDSTLYLFREEYHVPLLSPEIAAVAGTASELGFGLLVLLGLGGRLSAFGLFAVNLMAVVSYKHVLFAEGFEAALGDHWLWGTILAVLCVHGLGNWSLDRLCLRLLPRLDPRRGALAQ
jgi:putative oxidoreductase